MRILHVLAERGFSGGENQLLALVKFLRERGHEQVFVLDDRAQFLPVVRDLGLEVHPQRFRNNIDLIAAAALRRAMRRLRPELIHFACSRSHKIGAMASVFGARLAPRVVTRRMDYPVGRSPFHAWAYRGAVQGIIAVSTGVHDALLAAGVDPARVHVVHDGVDTAAFAGVREPGLRAAARASIGLGDRDVFGLTTASLHRRKGHDVLVEALGGVRVPDGSRLVWMFAGDGPERERLRARAGELRERIELRVPGQVEGVAALLGAADLFCLPSRFEGLGVALLEASAAGVPCIASDVGGMRDVIVDGETGLLIPVGDADRLRAAIQGLIDDPSRAAALGAAGGGRARAMFDLRSMCEQTESVYLELAAGTDGGRRPG